MNAGCKYLYNAQARAASLVQRQSSSPPGWVTHISRQKTSGVAGRGLGPALPRPWPPSRRGWRGCLPTRGLRGCFMSSGTSRSTSVLGVAEKQLFKGSLELRSLRLVFMGYREAEGTLRSPFPGGTLPIPVGGGGGEPPPGSSVDTPHVPVESEQGARRALGALPVPKGPWAMLSPHLAPPGAPSCLTPLPGVHSQRRRMCPRRGTTSPLLPA